VKTIFSYLLDANKDTSEIISKPSSLFKFFRYDITSLYDAIFLKDELFLRGILKNIYIHYGIEHYNAALEMVNGIDINTVVANMESAATTSLSDPYKKIKLIPILSNKSYLFNLNSIDDKSLILNNIDETIYVVSVDESYFNIIESAPCIPERLEKAKDMYSSSRIFDFTVDYSIEDIANFIIKVSLSSICFKRTARIVYISNTSYSYLLSYFLSNKPILDSLGITFESEGTLNNDNPEEPS
jgi:hypothetical protein